MDSSATNPTLGHAALELTNLVGAAEVRQLEFPWIPSDQRQASFVTCSFKRSSRVPCSFARAGHLAFWIHAV